MNTAAIARDLEAFSEAEGADFAESSPTGRWNAPQEIARDRPSLEAKQRGKAWKWLLPAVVIGAALVMYQPWNIPASVSAATEDSSAEVSQAESLKSVTVARPSPATASSVVLPATVRPWQSTVLHARVSGYLRAWHHDLGATVKAGELLAEIETPELDQEVAQAEALAQEATAAAVQAQAERVESQADLKVAEAQLDRAVAAMELAKSQLARREKLLIKQVVTQEEFDTYSRDVEVRVADVAAAKSDVEHRRTSLDTRAAVINAREATAASRRANVERLKELQGFKRIVAPFNGSVTQRSAEVGMLVTAGKEALFTVEDMSKVRVQINVPQTYSLQTMPGTKAIVNVPESAAQVVTGTITRISDSVDASNRTMLAEMELENSTHRFQPGSYAQVTLATAPTDQSWTIPTNTLSMRVDGPHVAMVNQRNEVTLKPVSLGRDLGKRIVVIEGIDGQERLIVNPGDNLSSGLRVRVQQDRPKAVGVVSVRHDPKEAG